MGGGAHGAARRAARHSALDDALGADFRPLAAALDAAVKEAEARLLDLPVSVALCS